MTVGDVTESIEVTAETPLLSTAEASLGQVVDERRVLELPIFSGNAMEFTLLAPGTVNGTDMRLRKAPFNNAPSQFSTDGSGLFNNEFNIDGITNTFSDSVNVRVAFSPPAGLHRRVQGVDLVLRRPKRPHHGLGRQHQQQGRRQRYPRKFVLVAAPLRSRCTHHLPEPQRPAGSAKIAVYQDNRYGGAGGGPVILPKLYNGQATRPSGTSRTKPTNSAIPTSARPLLQCRAKHGAMATCPIF